ncbi:MAG: PilT/PilU family type 4a pilus ATPase [Myxococcota bacterium]
MSAVAVLDTSQEELTTILRILQGALASKASDIHLRVGVPPVVRIEGAIVPLDHPPLDHAQLDAAARAFANWSHADRQRLSERQCEFGCDVPDVGRFRVHLYRQRGARAAVLRHIPTPLPELAALRIPPVLKQIALSKSGLIAVTGATGNGKSTTIGAMLSYMNRKVRRHVVTIEEPIEFVFEDQMCTFSQREVGFDVASFSEGIVGALREDPDVIFIGELRTPEEFELALHAAETGLLVVCTMHAGDVMAAVQRMINMYPSDFRASVRDRLASALRAVIAQKLLPIRGGGRERVLVTELLRATGTVRDCVREAGRFRSIPQVLDSGAHEHGTHTFDAELLKLVRAKVLDLDVARGAARSPKDLVRSLTLTR